jgi:hypothetical protein
MQRRKLLKIGMASSAVLLVAGGAMVLLQPGLNGRVLSAGGREVFAAIGRAVLDRTLPADPNARAAALHALMDRIDSVVQGLPPQAQGELAQLLALMASHAGRLALAGLATPWTEATVAEIQQALQGMRLSRLALRQQAYAALHDITASAYFSDASTWPLLGYPGPLKI